MALTQKTTLLIKGGYKPNLPELASRELAYCIDTNELYIGTSGGNVLVNRGMTLDELTSMLDGTYATLDCATAEKDGLMSKDDFVRLGNIESELLDKIDNSAKGVAGGVAELDDTGKVPASQLPSFVDDVLEFANLDAFPETGESGKIYIALDTNMTYRWGGTTYVNIASSLALGQTEQTAHRGDHGHEAYLHASTNDPDKELGLYKVSVNTKGHITSASAVGKTDITALGIASTDTATSSASGLMSATDKAKLDGIATNANNYVLPVATASALGGVKSSNDVSVNASTGVITVNKATRAVQDGYGNRIDSSYKRTKIAYRHSTPVGSWHRIFQIRLSLSYGSLELSIDGTMPKSSPTTQTETMESFSLSVGLRSEPYVWNDFERTATFMMTSRTSGIDPNDFAIQCDSVETSETGVRTQVITIYSRVSKEGSMALFTLYTVGHPNTEPANSIWSNITGYTSGNVGETLPETTYGRIFATDAVSATPSKYDGEGNVITETYATKEIEESAVLKSGATMTGALTTIAPTENGHAANKQYVDDAITTAMSSSSRYRGAFDASKTIAENNITEIKAGDYWRVTVSGSASGISTPSSPSLTVGDSLIANKNKTSDIVAEDFDAIDNTESPDTLKEATVFGGAVSGTYNSLAFDATAFANQLNSTVPTFTIATERVNISTTDSMATVLGKVQKHFADLKLVAFTGDYNDLTNKPSIPQSANGATDAPVSVSDAAADVGTSPRYAKADHRHQLALATASVRGGVKVDGEHIELINEKIHVREIDAGTF